MGGCIQLIGVGKLQGTVIQRHHKFQSQKYSTLIANRMAYFSKIAYSNPKRIKSWNFQGYQQTLKLQQIQIIQNQDYNILVYIGYDHKRNQIIVVFRGTQFSSAMNWLIDISCQQVDWHGNPQATKQATIHKGFNTCFNAINISVTKYLKQLCQKYSQAKVMITGHSLGAGVATLYAVSLTSIQKIQDHQICLYTYGQPRVGNKVFYKLVQNRLKTFYRIIHDDDVIARVPNINYYHCGKQVVYSQGMTQYKICEPDSKYAKEVFDGIDIFHDHAPTDYIKLKIENHEGQFQIKVPQDKKQHVNESEKKEEAELAQKRLIQLQKIHKDLIKKLLPI